MNKAKMMTAAALVLCALLLGGCATALIGPDKTEDTASASASASEDTTTIVVAEVNGESIYKDKFEEVYSGLTSSTDYATDEEAIAATFDYLIEQKVIEQKMEELGYDTLSDAEIAEVEEEMSAVFDEIITGDHDAIVQDLDENYTDEELAAAEQEYVDTLLSYYGYTRESYLQIMTEDAKYKKAVEELVGETAPSDAEIKAKYDEYVADDQEAYKADQDSYISSVNAGATIYYVPAGVRTVRQVLISIDSELQSAIDLLRGEGYDAAADVLLKQGKSDIKDKANEVVHKLTSGELTFDEAIAQYNTDTGQSEKGYPVMAGTTVYMDTFTEGAMALSRIGQQSGLVETDYGYHIIEYYTDEPEGAVSIDLVRDEILEELQATKQSEAWLELIEQWKSEAAVVKHEENI